MHGEGECSTPSAGNPSLILRAWQLWLVCYCLRTSVQLVRKAHYLHVLLWKQYFWEMITIISMKETKGSSVVPLYSLKCQLHLCHIASQHSVCLVVGSLDLKVWVLLLDGILVYWCDISTWQYGKFYLGSTRYGEFVVKLIFSEISRVL